MRGHKIKGSLNSWKVKIHIDKMVTILKLMYRFNAIYIKLTIALFTELGNTIIKFTCNQKRSRQVKVILGNKGKVEGIPMLGFKL